MRRDDDSDCTDADKSLHSLLSADPPPFSVLPHSTLSQTGTAASLIMSGGMFLLFCSLLVQALVRVVTQRA